VNNIISSRSIKQVLISWAWKTSPWKLQFKSHYTVSKRSSEKLQKCIQETSASFRQ